MYRTCAGTPKNILLAQQANRCPDCGKLGLGSNHGPTPHGDFFELSRPHRMLEVLETNKINK